MTGWVLFVLTLIVAVGLGLALKRRTDDEITRLRDESRSEVSELKSEARSRVDRIEREASKSQNKSRDDLLKDLIPMFDALLLARDGTEDPDVRAGLDLIVTDFERAMARHGIEHIAPQPGDGFDPAVHEAVETVASSEHEPGAVGRCHRGGWRTSERVIRPAMVGVVRAEEPVSAQVTSEA